MEVDLRNIHVLVTPYLETDDASGGGDVNGVSVCSFVWKIDRVLETKVLGVDNNIWT